MDYLLGLTPIAGANQTGTSTQKKQQQIKSPTAAEKALDNSNDEPDGGGKKCKVIDLAVGKYISLHD